MLRLSFPVLSISSDCQRAGHMLSCAYSSSVLGTPCKYNNHLITGLDKQKFSM